jgi:hypothetical protein
VSGSWSVTSLAPAFEKVYELQYIYIATTSNTHNDTGSTIHQHV